MLRDFFLGFIKIHILHHATREGVYGAGLMEELAGHGYRVSPGTLYPLLHQMERSGYLACRERLVEGRRRKYYYVTPQGRRALAEARDKIAALVKEVLGHDGKTAPRA